MFDRWRVAAKELGGIENSGLVLTTLSTALTWLRRSSFPFPLYRFASSKPLRAHVPAFLIGGEHGLPYLVNFFNRCTTPLKRI
jgi:hypothetical protein